MRARPATVAVLALLLVPLVAACAQPADVGVDPADAQPADPRSAAPSGKPGRYTVTATVLENAEHGPQLCFHVMESLPPQCGGADIVGWTWDGLAHEEVRGTRWGWYALVGFWDGTTLTLDGPAAPPAEPGLTEPGVDFRSPCEPPPGGWKVIDAAKASQAALDRANLKATAMPGFAGLWIDQNGGENDPRKLVLNVRFTGDPATREAALRQVWGGALCLSRAERSLADLDRIQSELTSPDILQSSIDVVNNRIDLGKYVATAEEQARLDATYGPGVVRLRGFLQPA
jgi:hypothetical protein